jgi:molybdate-binding protein
MSKQVLITAGYGNIMDEYGYTPIYPGVERDVRVSTTKTSYVGSLTGTRIIINTLDDKTGTYLLDQQLYTADYLTPRSGFSL